MAITRSSAAGSMLAGGGWWEKSGAMHNATASPIPYACAIALRSREFRPLAGFTMGAGGKDRNLFGEIFFFGTQDQGARSQVRAEATGAGYPAAEAVRAGCPCSAAGPTAAKPTSPRTCGRARLPTETIPDTVNTALATPGKRLVPVARRHVFLLPSPRPERPPARPGRPPADRKNPDA